MSKSCGLLKAFQVYICYLLCCFLALVTTTGDTVDCQQVEIEDYTFADLPDHTCTETLTHSSGLYGTFTKEDRLYMVPLTLAQIDETHNYNANIPVLLNLVWM